MNSAAQERTGLFETIESIKKILENTSTNEIQYKNLSELCKHPASVEGLTLRAIDYSKPVVQSHNPGANEDLIVSMIDSGRITKEASTEHSATLFELEQVRREIIKAKRLTAAIKELPYQHRGILQDTYIFKFSKGELKEIYKTKYQTRLDEALTTLLTKINGEPRRRAQKETV